MSALTFEAVTREDHRMRYPGLSLAWQVLRAQPGPPAVLNAANEIAVAAFLAGKIRFDEIHAVNLETLQMTVFTTPESLEALLDIDSQARAVATAVAQRLSASR
jgi:1-deoxy-D-xylulose-5-phosphate reductoisomerase